ncbi:MAG: hypothetical protein R3F59_23870 [Myxococcota bacterium]
MLLLSLSLTPALAAPTDRLDTTLAEVGATPAQSAAVHDAVEAARPERQALRDEARSLRERLSALFLAETIDRDAVEAVRLDAVDWFDRASALALHTWITAAEALDVDQRAALQARRQARIERLRHAVGWQ